MNSTAQTINFSIKSSLLNKLEAFRLIKNLSESEIETLEIISNDKNLILRSMEDSKSRKTHPIRSILD